MGPHPYPWMVREFHRVIGDEAREQCRALGRDPDVVTACVGGGSNAIGIFSGFADTDAELVGVEPAGGAAVGRGVPGRRARHRCLPDAGRVRPGARGALDLGRARLPGRRARALVPRRRSAGPVRAVTDAEVIDGFQLLSRTEGIIPALEPAHALAWVVREAPSCRADGAAQPVGPRRQGRRPDDGDPRLTGCLEAAGRCAPARRRGAQAARALHHRAAWDPAGRTRCVPPRRRAPTRSRSASRSPTRSWTAR
jgi:hypothetical protein